MAIKIYQSQLTVKKPTVLPIGQTLSQPFELAIQAGASVSKLGKAIDDIRDRRKETKYTNQARKAAKEILPLMYEEFSLFRTSSDTGDVKDFFKKTDYKNYKKFVRFKDKIVKEKVKKLIFDEQIRLGGQLTTETTNNFKTETITGIEEDMFGFSVDMASNDGTVRALAKKKMETYVSNPEVQSKFTKVQLQDLISKTKLDARKLQVKFQTKNNPIDVLERAEEISKIFKNKAEVKQIIKNAKNSLVSKTQAFDLNELTKKTKSENQQLENFTNILLRFRNKNKPDYQQTLPTLDDINDLEKLGQLNSAQANALYQIYLDPDKVSKRDIFDQVNLQYLIADTVDDIDAINRSVNFNEDLITDLDIKDITSFNKLADKFKADPETFADFKFYNKQLNNDLGKVDGWDANWGADKSKDKSLRLNAVKIYNGLVSDGMTPEDAYLKVLSRVAKSDQLPTIDMIIQPISIGLENLNEQLKKKPTEAFNDLRNKVATKYKFSKDIGTLKHDLAQLDLMEDLFILRKSMAPKKEDDPYGFTFAWSTGN
tara:strand:+ start:493 stop:2118 length:1626 start_codon:yes stop_codon:yes gene_type:complete